MAATPIPASEEEILAACEHALGLAPEQWLPNLPVSKKVPGASDWHRFEHDAWPIGESIRRAFVQTPRFKKSLRSLEKILEVVRCVNLRRGRQSFVMALGFVGARGCAGALAAFLTDRDIDGHVVDTLLKMKAPGFARGVFPLMESDRAWIRNLARKYVERYPGT